METCSISGSRPRPAAEGRPPRRILFRRDPDPVNRVILRLIFFLWRIRHGWILTFAIGTVLAAIPVWLLATHAGLPRIVMHIVLTMALLSWLCLALLTGMFRRSLRGRPARWDQLNATRKVARVLVAAVGTMLLLAPFGWLAYLILR